jgi:hypothetical protein
VRIALQTLLAGLMLAYAIGAGAAEINNEAFSYSDVLSAKTISKSDCEGQRNASWVETEWQEQGV